MLVSVELSPSHASQALRHVRALMFTSTLLALAACSDDKLIDESGLLSAGRSGSSSAGAGNGAPRPAADGGELEQGDGEGADSSGAGASGSSGAGRSGSAGSSSNTAGKSGAAGKGGAAGAAGAAGIGSPQPDEDAGVSEEDAGLEEPADSGPAEPADAGPEGPLVQDPAAPGPFQVTLVPNVGRGSESPRTEGDIPGSDDCEDVAAVFGEGSPARASFGPVPEGTDSELYTLYRPATWQEGATHPLLVWGNGTCELPAAYDTLLRHLASHGFIVIAPNSRYVGALTQPMRRALDWALSANADPTSGLYGRINPRRIGVFGHAQGAGAAATLADDPRVRAAVALNGNADAFAKPTLFITSDGDLNPGGVRTGYQLAQTTAAFIQFHLIPGGGNYPGHFTLSSQPERVVGPVTAWFRAQLTADRPAAEWFVGASCKLCSMPREHELITKGLD